MNEGMPIVQLEPREAFLLALGFCSGFIQQPENKAALVESIKAGQLAADTEKFKAMGLSPNHLLTLHAALTDVLQEAGVLNPKKSPQEILEMLRSRVSTKH